MSGGSREEEDNQTGTKSQENENRMLELLEFSCPYGRISHGKDTLELTYQHKKEKYASLAEELRQLRRQDVRVTAVIVSSMGAVYTPSLKDMQKVLKCTDRQIKEIGKQMSETVIRGSLAIWRQDTCERHEEHREQEREIMEQEIIEVQRIEEETEEPRNEESDEENEPEEDDEMDKWDTEEERDSLREKDQDEQEPGGEQLRDDRQGNREEERRENEEEGNMADDEGGSFSD